MDSSANFLLLSFLAILVAFAPGKTKAWKLCLSLIHALFSFLFSLPLPQSSLILKIFEFPFSVSSAIGCYECDSSKNFTCTEFWDPNLDVTLPYLSPDCSHVFEVRETSNFPRNQLLKLVEFEFLPRPPTASRWPVCSTASLERSASALPRRGEITASTSRGRGTFRYGDKIWQIDSDCSFENLHFPSLLLLSLLLLLLSSFLLRMKSFLLRIALFCQVWMWDKSPQHK